MLNTHTQTMMSRRCVPPVLSLLGLGLLVASRHLGFVTRLSGGADFDGRVFKRRGRDGNFGTALRTTGERCSGFECFSQGQRSWELFVLLINQTFGQTDMNRALKL